MMTVGITGTADMLKKKVRQTLVRINTMSKLQRPWMQGTPFVFNTRRKAEPVVAHMVRTRGERRFPLPFEAEEENGEKDKEGRLLKA